MSAMTTPASLNPQEPNLEIEALKTLVEELREIILPKEQIASQLVSDYEARIADLQDENERLTQDCNDALLIREAIAVLDNGSGDNSNGPEYPDVSPILEQRIINLRATLDRVRKRASKKEAEYQAKIDRLEVLALENIQEIFEMVKMNLAKNANQ